MKIVSIEVAKAIKEAGYPQGMENTAYYNENGVLIKPFVFNGGGEIADAPTYIEVWLWLWREKKKWIDVSFSLDEDGGHLCKILLHVIVDYIATKKKPSKQQ